MSGIFKAPIVREKLVRFPEASLVWEYSAKFRNPIVSCIYVTEIGFEKLDKPVKVEAFWESVGTFGIRVSFNKMCSGFVILY